MTDVSPSTTKVNDFLSSLSQLSQERLREDQERQRRLQRNIDELQLRLNSTSPVKSISVTLNMSASMLKSHYGYSVPDLKFNRSKISEEVRVGIADDGPKLPKRPAKFDTDDKAPPPLPRRKYKDLKQEDQEDQDAPPALPTRKKNENETEELHLLNPVPRKSSFPLPKSTQPSLKPAKPVPVKPDFKMDRPKAGQHRSFRDIENIIKSEGKDTSSTTKKAVAPPPPRPPKKVQSTTVQKEPNAVAVPPAAPAKPVKSDWLTSLASAKTTTFTPQSPESKKGSKSPVLVKPRAKEVAREEEEAEFILKFKELKPPKKPVFGASRPVAAKSTPELPLAKPKPIEKPLKPVALATEKKDLNSTKSFETKEEAEFKSKFAKLKTGPIPPKKPKTLSSFSEPPPEFQTKFNKIAAKSPQKLQRPATTGSLGSYKERDTAELRSQLERLVSARNKGGAGSPSPSATASTSASASAVSTTRVNPEGVKEVTIKRADTWSSGEKLVHPTKARTKGPKRRLPKTIGKASDAEVNPVKQDKQDKQLDEQMIPELKITKKVGPPINKHTKPKEVGELKPSRVVSGDFFI